MTLAMATPPYQQGDAPQADQQGGEGFLRLAAGHECVRRTHHGHPVGILRIDGRGDHLQHTVHVPGVDPGVEGSRLEILLEEVSRHRFAYQCGPLDVGVQRHLGEDADHLEPLPTDIDAPGAGQVVDAQPFGRQPPDHRHRKGCRRLVEESSGQHGCVQRSGQVGGNGENREAAGLQGGHQVVDQDVHVEERGGRDAFPPVRPARASQPTREEVRPRCRTPPSTG